MAQLDESPLTKSARRKKVTIDRLVEMSIDRGRLVTKIVDQEYLEDRGGEYL